MKQWFTILLLIWSAAALGSADQRSGTPEHAGVCQVVIASPENHSPEVEDQPLVAVTSPVTRQIAGAEQVTPRSSRTHDDYLTATPHTGNTSPRIRITEAVADAHTVCMPGILSGERYIYFLRRIVI